MSEIVHKFTNHIITICCSEGDPQTINGVPPDRIMEIDLSSAKIVKVSKNGSEWPGEITAERNNKEVNIDGKENCTVRMRTDFIFDVYPGSSDTTEFELCIGCGSCEHTVTSTAGDPGATVTIGEPQ